MLYTDSFDILLKPFSKIFNAAIVTIIEAKVIIMRDIYFYPQSVGVKNKHANHVLKMN